MAQRRVLLTAAALTLTLALAGLSSCSKSSSPTSPGGGGGSRELNSGDFGPGANFSHRFMTAGAYAYHCIHHSPMTGVVNVADAATDTLVNVSIQSATTPFPGASVKTGGRVIWTNNTAMVHTVTSD